MSCYTSDNSEDMRRRNISQFLEGLLDDEKTDESVHVHSNPPKSYKISSRTKKRTHPQIKSLPESELVAYTEYPGLFQVSVSNVLKTPFSIHNIKHNDNLVKIYTGIPAAKGFFNLANRFSKSEMKYYHGWIVGQLTMKQQLLMTLMKLKLGMDDIHLSHRFNCSLETVANTVLTWLLALHRKLYHVLVHNLEEQWSFDIPVCVDTMNIYSETPKNPHLPHKTPMEPFTAVVVARTDGMVIHAGDMYVWTNEKADLIEDCDFFCRLRPGSVIALKSELCGFVDVPDGVFTLSFEVGDGGLLTTRRELEKRLMEFHILRCIPIDMVGHVNVVWQVVVALANFSKLKAFTI